MVVLKINSTYYTNLYIDQCKKKKKNSTHKVWGLLRKHKGYLSPSSYF